MKAREFAKVVKEISPEAELALAQIADDQEVDAESLVKGFFAALKAARDTTRQLDSLLLASEGELPERIRALGIDCSDDEVLSLVDQFGRNYCW